MRRILFQWGRVTLYSYPTMLYLGIVFGIFGQHHAATVIQIDPTRALTATLILLAPALVGARLLFVIAHWPAYRREPRRIWRASEGGAAMYGGLLIAVPLSVPVLAILGLSFGA